MNFAQLAEVMSGNTKPAFIVTRASTGYTRKVGAYVEYEDKADLDRAGHPKIKHRYELRDEEVPVEEAGYIVAFPMKGHSIRVTSRAELERLGFNTPAGMYLVDEKDGDEQQIPPALAIMMQVFAQTDPRMMNALTQALSQAHMQDVETPSRKKKEAA